MATSTAPYRQLALGTVGELVTGLDELAQALRILINTPVGSRPRRPDFGCDLTSHMDKPGPQAVGAIIREVSRAVAVWEPRITLQTVRVKSLSADGGLTLAITWTPTTESASSSDDTTQVTEFAA